MEDCAHIRLLDLGCAGGGLVRSLLSDGCFSLGVEGSDVSRRYKMAEWATCPWHLLTADITQPFTIVDNADRPVLFNVVTAWEVLEHIPEAGIPVLIENVLRHLGDGGGFFIASVVPGWQSSDRGGVPQDVAAKGVVAKTISPARLPRNK